MILTQNNRETEGLLVTKVQEIWQNLKESKVYHIWKSNRLTPVVPTCLL